jgi:hypothetical protein
MIGGIYEQYQIRSEITNVLQASIMLNTAKIISEKLRKQIG